MSEGLHNESESTETTGKRRRGRLRGPRRERTRSRAALPSSPPGAGGRLLDLYRQYY